LFEDGRFDRGLLLGLNMIRMIMTILRFSVAAGPIVNGFTDGLRQIPGGVNS